MLKKISVDTLQLGMHVHELCGSWMEHPFWRTKFIIDDPEDIRRIIESGIREVWIDSAKGLDVPGETTVEVTTAIDAALTEVAVRKEPPKSIPMAEELKRAAQICSTSKAAMVSMFQDVRMGNAVSAEAAGAVVDEISSSVLRNSNALISLVRLKTVDDYTYMHSVAVCALMIALARQLNLDEATTRELGMAGLLHDLGKAFMPPEVLNKPGKLTDEEFAIMKRHPAEGHKALVECGSLGEIPLDVVLHHHEKMDGSGYPERLPGDRISLYAKMGAVCDVYDAITSNRPYKAGWDPAESIRKMAEWCKGHFDEAIFQAFVKSIGIYPVGSLVRLQSGRLGVVVDQTGKSLLKPKVKVFFSIKSNLRIPPEIIDLSIPSIRDKIISIEESAQWNFPDLNHLWGSVDIW
ncbi:MAG: HD-GYP domain-containing protein [Parasulfuritortus sp.]|nr:HD-GYP domain-containing protein [Parasulfuritortus sp.]